jgi:single-strand DNA-binding protein
MLNKVILMGRLTKEPELRYGSTNNTTICNFTLAVDRNYSKQGEEKQTDFIPVVTFGKTAEFANKYFRKGSQVAVCGRLQTRSWDDTEGKKHSVTEVVADEVFFADSKKEEQQAEQSGFTTVQNDEELPF